MKGLKNVRHRRADALAQNEDVVRHAEYGQVPIPRSRYCPAVKVTRREDFRHAQNAGIDMVLKVGFALIVLWAGQRYLQHGFGSLTAARLPQEAAPQTHTTYGQPPEVTAAFRASQRSQTRAAREAQAAAARIIEASTPEM